MKNSQFSTRNSQLTIGWLYPDLMSTYGDRGNITVLQKRCEWRGILLTVYPIDHQSNLTDLHDLDLIFGGGSQDREQEIVMRDLKGKKAELIKQLIEEYKPALFVCGSPQLMGKWYEPSVGQRIDGLGIFDMVSRHPGPNKPRLIGKIIAEVYWENLTNTGSVNVVHPRGGLARHPWIVGFENHGGRTFLEKNAKPFAKVIKGFGNNGEDGTEGVVYKNAIGCYFHGPLLPKNPHIADFLIQRALEVKYKTDIKLEPLDDTLEWQAHNAIVKRLGVSL